MIDGSLVLPALQLVFHSVTRYLLHDGLRRTLPDDLRVRQGISVILGRRQRPVPDLIVIHASARPGPHQTSYSADAVLLAVEVMTPASVPRDRDRKRYLYAEAGIRHFWRVEEDSGKPVVYVYELDPATRCYVPTGIHRDQLKVPVPFPIDIDLTEIERL
jgi:Uma2 family endonuclease